MKKREQIFSVGNLMYFTHDCHYLSEHHRFLRLFLIVKNIFLSRRLRDINGRNRLARSLGVNDFVSCYILIR